LEFQDPDILIYQSNLLSVGLFRCHPGHPLFEDSGPIKGNLLVFPRTSVYIQHAGGEPIVTNPNVVMFYNPGQVYRRYKISERGDHCEWFAFDRQVILDALQAFDSKIEAHAARPFRLTHGLSDTTSFLLQRKVVEHLLHEAKPDKLFVEETMLHVLEQTIDRAYRVFQPKKVDRSGQRERVRAVQAAIAARFTEDLNLENLAAEFGYSPYYLCRIFRKHSGTSIHQYLTQIRLRTAMEWIDDGQNNLTELALRLGYSSHSHFTMAFRKAFGAPPSQIHQSFPKLT
jgi:AraC family transcriptional regulator